MTSAIVPQHILVSAVKSVFTQRKALVKALALPILIHLALDWISSQIEANDWLLFVVTFAGLVVEAIFVTIIHRVIILGPASVSSWGIGKLTGREMQFIRYGIYLGLCLGLLALVGTVVAIWFNVPPLHGLSKWVLRLSLGGVVAWIVCRLLLVFPGIAVDQKLTFRESWALTRQIQLPVFLTLMTFPVIHILLKGLVALIPNTSVLPYIFRYVFWVLGVAALSLLYSEIREQEHGQPQASPVHA